MEQTNQQSSSPPVRTLEQARPTTTVHTPYVTAQLVPRKRNLKELMKTAIEIAELSGELFFYRWETSSRNKETGEVKKGFIVGHSVKLTNEAVRLFGNCAIHQQPVIETPNAWIFTTAFIDLETGFQRDRHFRMDKQWPVYGKMDKFRKDDIRFQIGQSKSDRNVVLNSLPQILTDRMKDAAINSVRQQIEFKIKDVYGGNIQKAIDELLKAFASYDINQDLIEKKIGLKRDKWDINTLVMLTGDVKALQVGSETKDTLYSLDEIDDPHGGAKSETDKASLSTKQMSPGDPAKHQGYETSDDQKPTTDDNGGQVAELQKLSREELIQQATDVLGTKFRADMKAGDAFLDQAVADKVLSDPHLGSSKNNNGHLARFIMRLRALEPTGKAGF